MPSPRLDASRTERLILGGAVARIRQALGKSQESVANAIGVQGAWLSRVESGTLTPSIPRMVQLAQALGVDLDDISYLTRVVLAPGHKFEDVDVA